ncbi:MAG: hypothetical protein JSW28_08435, partial [Thermoplasmata archaeon]
MTGKFEPKIIGYLCNWCHSAFFFVTKFSAGSGSQRNCRESKIPLCLGKHSLSCGKWVKKKLA